MHHIVSDIPGGPPVIFQHGFVSASDTILSQGRNVGLGFLLAQAGYDVWLPDLRGGWYSHEHLKYKTTDPKFWDFTFHEMGYYDVPAAIDKILDVTGYKQVFFIGHSMGCTVFFVMASLRPEYDRKVRAAVMLAPVAYTPTLQELKSKSFRSFLQEAEPFYNYVIGRSVYELFPRGYQSISIVRALCSPSPIQNLCFDIVALGFGENRRNLNRVCTLKFFFFIVRKIYTCATRVL
ncbi:hypothetical protein O3M35_009276 [Rhynocoris fuscipes]|uniref:AB hydrolase-1 domain-containing protein n=1 Tax=Rhynocoris fuscipes TaxID=488301 RepID=A0AAW1D3L6_9HEMI